MNGNETALLNLMLHNEQDTRKVGAGLAYACHKGDCILLKGDLGAGKTTFARGFIQALGNAEDVVSPTFTLAQTYPTRAGWPVWHFDFYRVENPLELDHVGLEDALETGVTLIEWPEIAVDRLPPQALTVQLAYAGEGQRKVIFSGDDAIWKARLEKLG